MGKILKPIQSDGPVNGGEQRLIDFLYLRLPDNYYIIPNGEYAAKIGGAPQFFEYDCIVVAPHAIYHLENKDWGGQLVGDDELWFVNGAERKNPHKSATLKSRILASKIQTKNPAWRAKIVTAVTLSNPNQTKFGLDPQSACYDQTFTIGDDLVSFITDPTRVNQAIDKIAPFAFDIAEYLSGATTQRTHAQKTRVAGYEIDEILQQTEDFTEYLCHPKAFITKYYKVREYPLVRNESPSALTTFRHKVENAQMAQEMMESSQYIHTSEYRLNDDETCFYEISKWMNDCTLKAKLRNHTFLQIEKLKIITDIAKALKTAHDKNIYHRAVCPENIFILNDGTAQLGNFNTAWFVEHLEMGYTVNSGIDKMSSPYSAPEFSDDDVNASSDIFSLGVIIYELMTGRLPFASSFMFTQAGGELAPEQMPTKIVTDLPEWIDELVSKTITADMDKRWQSAQEVIDFIASHAFGTKEDNDASKDETKPKELKDLRSGDEINNDLVLYDELGKGGFGRVFRALHRTQNQYYAAKIFDRELAASETINEFEALKNLTHRNIVRFVYNGQTNQGMFFTLMELLEGDNLSDYTKSKGDLKLPISEIYKMAKEILEALVFMQGRETPIFHRDIKPNNIMWHKRERYVLIDFNISTSTDDKSFGGTLPYLAPDLVKSNKVIDWDCSADTFSLGVTLYELLAHNYPWPGSNPYPSLKNPATPIMNYRADLSADFADFVMKSLITDRTKRFRTAKEMLEALTGIGIEGILKKGPDVVVTTYRGTSDIVDYINSLYSQSSHGNSGTRAGLTKSSFDKLTYTETKLDKKLISDIRSLKYKLIIITGNAGDGKTAFIHHVEELDPMGERCDSRNGSRFNINGVKFESNYDGSQDEDNLTNTEVLDQFFSPFAGLNDYTLAKEGRIIAINEGRLVDFLSTRPEFKNLEDNIEEYFRKEGHTNLIPGLMIINLNHRSVTARTDDEPSLLHRQIKALTKSELWQKCQGCPVADRCFIKYNVESFQDASAGDEIINRLEWLLRTVVYKRELHITMRDLRSFIAFMLTRDHSCDQVKTMLANITADDFDPEYYWQYYYFNITAVPFHRKYTGFEQIGLNSDDRLVKMLRDTDIARVSIPALDRDLYYTRKDAEGYLVFSDRQRSLLDEFNRQNEILPYYELEKDPNRNFILKERHQSFIRHHYFEGKSDFRARLPYQSIRDFYDNLHKNADKPEKLIKTMQTIAEAISRSEGCDNKEISQNYLLLSCSHINDPLAKSYRLFDVKDFELVVNHTPHLTEYLEHESDSFTFRHKSEHYIKLTVSLDLFEMLYYIRKGFSPSLNDLQGRFIELQIFKNLLESKTYDKILVTKNNKKYFAISLASDNTLTIEPFSAHKS